MSQGLEIFKTLSYRRYDVHISATDDVVFDAWPGAIIRNNLLYAAEQIRIQKSARSLREQIDDFSLEADHPLFRELKKGFPKGYVLTNFSYDASSNRDIQPNTDIKESIVNQTEAVLIQPLANSKESLILRKGDTFSFSLLLIGHFYNYRFYFFEAIRQMCERGIGKPLTPFSLIDIAENPSSPITLNDLIEPDADDILSEITIRFLTPVILFRLRDKKNTRLSYQDKTNRFPSFYQLIRSCFSRLQKLYALYENPAEKTSSFFDESSIETYLEKAGFPLLKSADIQHITLQNTLKKGMKNELPLAGYIGRQTYFGYLHQYLPLLKFMAELGVGNETVYGIGRFEIEKLTFTNRIDENQKNEVENETQTLDSFYAKETDEYQDNPSKMIKLSQLIVRFKNQINQSEIPLFAEKIVRRIIKSGNVSNYPYYYPMIQCKRINGRAAIICIGEGTESIGNFFASAGGQANIGDKETPMEIDTVKAEKTTVQAWDNDFIYTIRKYLPLSPENNMRYQEISDKNIRMDFLNKIIRRHLLFFAKSIGIHFDREVTCKVTELEEKANVKYKNHTFASFDLRFRTNVSLPNYIGLGIGVNHGFGIVARIRSQKNS